jgi:hypothetical protein
MMKKIFEKFRGWFKPSDERGQGALSAFQALFVGIGVLVLTVILIGVLGAKAYTVVSNDVKSFDGNSLEINGAMEQDVNAAIGAAFSGFSQSTTFLPLIILAVVFGLVLVIVGGGLVGGMNRF